MKIPTLLTHGLVEESENIFPLTPIPNAFSVVLFAEVEMSVLREKKGKDTHSVFIRGTLSSCVTNFFLEFV